MKASLVILILIVVGMIGFLLVYSLQHDMPLQATQANAAGYGSEPATGENGSAPASGGYGSEPATGDNGSAPASGGYGSEPATGENGSAPASGGYGN
jgi:hypothetical protein